MAKKPTDAQTDNEATPSSAPEPEAGRQAATAEAPAKPRGKKADKADGLRNQIAGARALVEHLKRSGTGAAKLFEAETVIKRMTKELGQDQLQPLKTDKAAMRAGAEHLIEEASRQTNGGAAWPPETVKKARAFLDTGAFK